jgi:excisionase family DNA binding protein
MSNSTSVPFAEKFSCTVDEAMSATGLGRSKFYQLIRAGTLETRRVGKRRLVLISSLKKLVDGHVSPA